MKTAIDILNDKFEPTGQDCKTAIQDLQLAITLNPSLDKIIECMKEYAEQVSKQALLDASEGFDSMNCYDYGGHCDLTQHRKDILETPIQLK